MKIPPRNLHQPIFNFKTILISIAQGFGVLIATFALFVFAIKAGRSELEARSFAFTSLVLANLMMIAINLSWSKNIHKVFLSANKMLFIVFAGALLCLSAVLYIPFFTNLFHLAPLGAKDFIITVIVMFASLVWFEILKFIKTGNKLSGE
jgi:Ca2+-transporting ATPase